MDKHLEDELFDANLKLLNDLGDLPVTDEVHVTQTLLINNNVLLCKIIKELKAIRLSLLKTTQESTS